MDAGLCDQAHHSLVATFVLLAHVLHQVEQQFTAQRLVPVHPGNVAELRLSCRGRRKPHGKSVWMKTFKSNQDSEPQEKEPFVLHFEKLAMILSSYQVPAAVIPPQNTVASVIVLHESNPPSGLFALYVPH